MKKISTLLFVTILALLVPATLSAVVTTDDETTSYSDNTYVNELVSILLGEVATPEDITPYDYDDNGWLNVDDLTALIDMLLNFNGYNHKSSCNLWNSATMSQRYYYAPGWSQIADPTCTVDGNSYTFVLPSATSATWQAQCFMETDITTTAANTYDFSCHIKAAADHNNVTVKLFKKGDDGTFFFSDVISLKAGEDYLFYKSNMPGIDIENVSLLFDFGGNPDNFEVTVSKIDIQEHKCDGIEAPEEGEDTGYDYEGEGNIWRTTVDANNNYTTFFYYAPGWSQIADPEFTGNNGVYTVALPTATSDQWQAQVHLITTIAAEAGVKYDFSCIIESTTDLPGATVKMTDTTDDGNYLFISRPAVPANTPTVVSFSGVSLTNGAAALKLVYDFGGNPENTNVTMKNIVFQKSAE